MIHESAPNNQKRLCLVIRFFIIVLIIFIVVVIYAKTLNLESVGWLTDTLFVLVLGAIAWFYRVSNSWKFDINGSQIDVQIYFNIFLRGKIFVTGGSEEKIYSCWPSKGAKFLYDIEGKIYLFEIKKVKNDNFFRCSVQEFTPEN